MTSKNLNSDTIHQNILLYSINSDCNLNNYLNNTSFEQIKKDVIDLADLHIRTLPIKTK